MRKICLAGLVMMFVLYAASAWSADLTKKQVEGFVHSMTELKPLFDSYADEEGDDGDASSTAQIMKDWTTGLRERQDFLAILKKNGLGLADWETVSQDVVHAYMAIKFGKDGKDAVAQMQESMRTLESSPDISEAQKEEILTQMRQGIVEFEEMLSAAPENQAMVRPFLSQLDTIFEWQD